MSHNGDNGRFTGNPETQGNETTEEEDPIERAFAAANGIDGVTMGEQTPMPAQTGEYAALAQVHSARANMRLRRQYLLHARKRS